MNDKKNEQSDPYLLISLLLFLLLVVIIHLFVILSIIKLIEFLYTPSGNFMQDIGNGLYFIWYVYIIIHIINIIISILLSILYFKKYVKKYSKNTVDNYTISILLVLFNIFVLLPIYMGKLSGFLGVFCFH